MSADLCDPQQWAEAALLYDQAAIQQRLPHRHELALLHGILHHDPARKMAVGFHDSRPTDFWVRGHIPGRPLMPGVVMIEIGAQLCSWLGTFDEETAGGFMGFAGLDAARFRGKVVPGDRLLVAGQVVRVRRNVAVYEAQGWVGRDRVFEAQITGVRV
ncbi:MAG TPA: hotdog domain-containing protein [Planctomycetota bacterium]|nr:hotdog domain-containing protein [Planctomycetota bacterium]